MLSTRRDHFIIEGEYPTLRLKILDLHIVLGLLKFVNMRYRSKFSQNVVIHAYLDWQASLNVRNLTVDPDSIRRGC